MVPLNFPFWGPAPKKAAGIMSITNKIASFSFLHTHLPEASLHFDVYLLYSLFMNAIEDLSFFLF
jgi:hypothetical protein